jgi:uncharacterized sporulation protein YeaH/YhbH (DUF444 family)
MSEDGPDLEQAHRLLAALRESTLQTTKLVERLEQERSPQSIAGPQEQTLREELSEVHSHIARIYERFPDTRYSHRNRGTNPNSSAVSSPPTVAWRNTSQGASLDH